MKRGWRIQYATETVGIRDENGFICMMTKPRRYAGQDARFNEEMAEMQANARLIAAAPDLLEAVKAIREWLLFNGPVQDDGITHPAFVKANNLANVAIAKAEGTPIKPDDSRP